LGREREKKERGRKEEIVKFQDLWLEDFIFLVQYIVRIVRLRGGTYTFFDIKHPINDFCLGVITKISTNGFCALENPIFNVLQDNFGLVQKKANVLCLKVATRGDSSVRIAALFDMNQTIFDKSKCVLFVKIVALFNTSEHGVGWKEHFICTRHVTDGVTNCNINACSFCTIKKLQLGVTLLGPTRRLEFIDVSVWCKK
jgi:hypothetical protein